MSLGCQLPRFVMRSANALSRSARLSMIVRPQLSGFSGRSPHTAAGL